MNFFSILLFSLCLFSFKVSAKDPFTLSEKSYNLKIGLGLRIKSNIRLHDTTTFKKNDPIITPFPYMRFKISRFELEPDKAKYAFVRNMWWDIDMRVHYTGHEYNDDDMAHRHKTLFGGLSLRFLLFKAKILKDLQNKSNAEIMIFSAVLPLAFTPGTTILLQGDIEYYDSEYVNYYFGVKQSEVKEGRPYYKGVKEKSYHFESIFMTRFSKNWLTRINAGYRKYGKRIEKSPTVKRANELDLLMGLVYEF